MAKNILNKKKKKKPGAPPGTIEFTGAQKMEIPFVTHLRFKQDHCETEPVTEDEIGTIQPGFTSWFDTRGIHDVKLIERIGRRFNIHPLVLEDIVNTEQRPKYEEYGKEGFIVMTSFTYDNLNFDLHTEQISLYFGENYLLSFQENHEDTFHAVRERLESGRGRIRARKSDYLAYALVDNVVDNYFLLLDDIETRMTQIENEISSNPTNKTKEKIHELKFQLLTLRKSIMPLREAVGKFSRTESGIVEETTGVFLRDLYDHVIRISDLLETYRDMLNGLQDLYLSELSLRMNNVMQVLTIITTIFVPLSFLAGLYGMNFRYMPELEWKNGYFYLLGLMGLIVLGSFYYFRKKKWL